jgi:hypothetical protein
VPSTRPLVRHAPLLAPRSQAQSVAPRILPSPRPQALRPHKTARPPKYSVYTRAEDGLSDLEVGARDVHGHKRLAIHFVPHVGGVSAMGFHFFGGEASFLQGLFLKSFFICAESASASCGAFA